MSLHRVTVTNYQSLKNVDLELGTFTVIVGASSSGKSALIRAFKALASNVRGTGMITRGEKAMAITAWTDSHTITLERLERSGSYKVTGGGSSLTFTKLAGEVPEQVTAALRIDPVTDGGSVNFANQFDKPYLLDESGAAVARVLGELTNVTVIFEAVRSANRIRANATSALKTRRTDLGGIRVRLEAFQGLSDRLKRLAEAEQLDAEAKQLTTRAGRLESALRTLRIAERAIEKAAVPDVPPADDLDDALRRYRSLKVKLSVLAEARAAYERLADDTVTLTIDLGSLQNRLHFMLEEAGVCPTCNQPIH